MIAMIDCDMSDDTALFVKWNAETTMVDECVKMFTDGNVQDITEEFEKIEELSSAFGIPF